MFKAPPGFKPFGHAFQPFGPPKSKGKAQRPRTCKTPAVELPADLAALAAIWPKLPENIRAAILALAAVKP